VLEVYMSAKNKETVRKVTKALLEGDLEGALNFCAEDVRWTHVGERTLEGKENIRRSMREETVENPALPRITVAEPIIADGDYVVVRGDATIRKAGGTGEYSFCQIYRLDDDEIAEIDSFLVSVEPRVKSTAARQ
jgi:uncharacterized protein